MAGLDVAYRPDGRPVHWDFDAWARLRVRREARQLQDPTGIRRFATLMQIRGPRPESMRAAARIVARHSWLRDHMRSSRGPGEGQDLVLP